MSRNERPASGTILRTATAPAHRRAVRRDFRMMVPLLTLALVLPAFAGCSKDSPSAKSAPPAISFPAKPVEEGPSEEDLLRRQFAADREKILAEIREHTEKGEYRDVFAKARPYLFIGDTELAALNNPAEKKVILETIRDIPGTDPVQNRDLYARLLELEPGNENYAEKYDRFAKAAAAYERKKASKLELLEWSTERGRYYFRARATVKNISGMPLHGVRATVDFRQSNGLLIVRKELPLQPDPFGPDDVFTLETKARLTQLMYMAQIDFKTALDRSVPWYQEEGGDEK